MTYELTMKQNIEDETKKRKTIALKLTMKEDDTTKNLCINDGY